MRGTGVAKLAAVSVAVVAHGALALALVATEDAQIEGARGGAEVRLGSAFADMSSGVVTAERTEDTDAIPSEIPEVIQTDRPVQTPPERPVRAVEAGRIATLRPEVTPILQAAQPVAPVAAEVVWHPSRRMWQCWHRHPRPRPCPLPLQRIGLRARHPTPLPWCSRCDQSRAVPVLKLRNRFLNLPLRRNLNAGMPTRTHGRAK